MEYSYHILVLVSLASVFASTTATLTPSGPTVSVDCGGQETFTCAVTGAAAQWTITGLRDGITLTRGSGFGIAGSIGRVTTTDANGLVQTSIITITGFTAGDDGGTVQCVNQADSAVQGMATVSVVSTTLASATAVMANVDQSVATLTWSEPSDSSATTSVSCTPPSLQCSSCTSSGCTIGGLPPSTSYTFSVARSRSGCDDSTATFSTVMSGANCRIASAVSTPTLYILSGVIPSVVLILINIISVVVVFLVTRHCYKKSAKGGSSSRREELYAQVEGKKVYEDINMTDSPAYGPTSSQNQ